MADSLINNKEYREFFTQVKQKIYNSQSAALKAINRELISLYWELGKLITTKQNEFEWGKSVVESLANGLQNEFPGMKGFSARNLWRMKQFYDTYKENPKLSAVLTEFPKDTKGVFKDSYVFEFLELPETHKENDLRKALLKHLKKFLLELGANFSFIGEEYPLQVGMKDFRVDLLLHHRDLNCLVVIELKVTEFQPEYIGKMQFYLEALDRDVKKPHENPSIGILICKTKDEEVVNYALSRNVSPTVIAEYETKLISKELLRKKLHELSEVLDYSKN